MLAAQITSHTSNDVPQDTSKYLSVLCVSTKLKIIRNLAKLRNIKLAIKRQSTIFNHLKNEKDKFAEQDKSRVYVIPMYNVDLQRRIHWSN